jgi:hypothetical protein
VVAHQRPSTTAGANYASALRAHMPDSMNDRLHARRRRRVLWCPTVMRGAKFVVAGALAAAVAAAAVPHAQAADPGDVEELIRQGVELRRAKKDQLSLPLFQKAYHLAPTPRTAAQLGLIEMALGYRIDAERHLKEALSSPHDIWVRKNRVKLEESLAKVTSAIGEVTVTGTPVGAEVTVNGNPVGQLPLKTPVRVGEGPTTIEVGAQGFKTLTRAVAVLGGRHEEVNVALEPIPSAPPRPIETPVPPTLLPTATPTPERPDVSPSGEGGGDRAANLRIAAWATASAAVVAAGFATFEALTWKTKSNQFDNQMGRLPDKPSVIDFNCAEQAPQRGGAGCQGIYDDMQRAKTFTIVGFAVAGALAAGSIVLFTVSSTSPESNTNLTLTCGLLPAPGAACRAVF